MAISRTSLSTLLRRIRRWVSLSPEEEQYLVMDLDEGIRALKRDMLLPWTITPSTLRVFAGIDMYPVDSNHEGLAYLDGQEDGYGAKPRPYYTSLTEFLQDPISNRSTMAEIWADGERFLGVRNKLLPNLTALIDSATQDTNYTISGDITAKSENSVIGFDNTSGSIKLTVVNSSGTGTITHTYNTVTDTEYESKYYFREIYLGAIPTAITISVGADASNKLTGTVTTQFSGQPFRANTKNIVAINLDTATSVGTPTTSFAYEDLTLTGAPTGTYYLGPSLMRPWTDMDYWFYNRNMVISSGATVADKEYFYNDNDVPQYDVTDALVCDDRFADCIMYDAMLLALANVENSKIYSVIEVRRERAWTELAGRYPDLEPIITTHRLRFLTQMSEHPIPSVNVYGDN